MEPLFRAGLTYYNVFQQSSNHQNKEFVYKSPKKSFSHSKSDSSSNLQASWLQIDDGTTPLEQQQSNQFEVLQLEQQEKERKVQQNFQDALSNLERLKKVEMIGGMVKLKKQHSSRSLYSSECSENQQQVMIENRSQSQLYNHCIYQENKKLDTEFLDNMLQEARSVIQHMELESLRKFPQWRNSEQKNSGTAKMNNNIQTYSKSNVGHALQKMQKSHNIPKKTIADHQPDNLRYSSMYEPDQRAQIQGKTSIQRQQEKRKVSPREQAQKEICLLFINKGYGVTIGKQFSKRQINSASYNSLLNSIIRGSIRKLCDIVTKNLGMKVKVFDGNQERLLRSPLVNCRRWMSLAELNTYFKIIKIVYGIKVQPIYNDEVVALYWKVFRQLSKRLQYEGRPIRTTSLEDLAHPLNEKFSKVADPSSLQCTNIKKQTSNGQKMASRQQKTQKSKANIKKEHVFNAQNFQKQIAQLFTDFKSYQSVYLMLNKKYPSQSWQKDKIKRTLQRLIKVGLKKVIKYRREYANQGMEMPSLNLNDNLVSQIINTKVGQQTRLNAVQCLLQNILTFQRTVHLINIINSCLYELSCKKK